jgi:hypothetical protein
MTESDETDDVTGGETPDPEEVPTAPADPHDAPADPDAPMNPA